MLSQEYQTRALDAEQQGRLYQSGAYLGGGFLLRFHLGGARDTWAGHVALRACSYAL